MKNSKQALRFVPVVLLSICCTACGYRTLPGTYHWFSGGDGHWTRASMTIHADSTFVYDGDSGDLFYTFGSTGKWRRQGNKLVLDSDRQADVVEVRDTDSDRIVVEVPGGSADDTSVMIVGVPGVSGTRYVRLNENGQAVFPKQEFSQFLITRTSGVSIMNFTIEDNRHDYYKVVLPPWDSYTDFENETWRIRGGDLFERVGRSTNRYDRK